jgi:riboflavin biosynthesis pyrimidine reductase
VRLIEWGRENVLILRDIQTDSTRAQSLGVRSIGIPRNQAGDGLSLVDAIRPPGVELWSHLLVEPGPTLAKGFFDENAADRLWVFRSSNRLDDESALSAAKIPDHFIETARCQFADDTLIEYLNSRSRVYFDASASADIVLTHCGR